MLIIKVWGLPEDQTEEALHHIHTTVVEAVKLVREIMLKGEKSILTLFPSDLMPCGLGTGILIEVTGLPYSLENAYEVRNQLAQEMGLGIQRIFPNAKVQCSVLSSDPERGFWSSAM